MDECNPEYPFINHGLTLSNKIKRHILSINKD